MVASPLLTTLAASQATDVMLTTIATAVAAGVGLIVVARVLRLPAIVLLLAGGILLGPAVWGEQRALVQPASLGDGLLVLVSLFVGLILFEGGLTLDVSGYRSAPTMIKRLLTIGVLITWSVTALTLRLFFDFGAESWRVSISAASLVIVTGPTVIAPLLKRIKIQPKLHGILHWEGVLIDPIGVFLALFCLEALIGATDEGVAVVNLLVRFGAGAAIGAAGGVLLGQIMKRRLIPEDLINIVALASAVLIFGVAEGIKREAGLLAVTVAGFVFGLSRPARIRRVREFKTQLTDLLIGTLFVLLAARLQLDQFASFGLVGAMAVAVVIFVVRPLSILVCGWGADLTAREKVFLSWVAPRGIVAASMASLFAIVMEHSGMADAGFDPKFVETFTYSVIIATIVLQGLTAGVVARLLKVQRPELTGWLIVGCHALARRVARFLTHTAHLEVVLVDTNARAVRTATAEGFTAIAADARDTHLHERREMQSIGNMLALTDNEDLNVRLCQEWRDVVGPDHVFRCDPSGGGAEPDAEAEEIPGRLVWSRLPRPSLVAGELERREATTSERPGRPPAGVTVLATLHRGQVRLAAAALGEAEDDDERISLVLRREADYLARAVRPEFIATCATRDMESIIRELLGIIARQIPKLPVEELRQEITERERAFPTALGKGVLVPHGHSHGLAGRVCAIGRLPEGLDMGAPDGQPVRLIFLLLSPAGDPEGHLATLAEIARLVADDTVRNWLIRAETADEVMRIVRIAVRG